MPWLVLYTVLILSFDCGQVYLTSGIFICFVYVFYGVRAPGSECVWYYINYLQRMFCPYLHFGLTWSPGVAYFLSLQLTQCLSFIIPSIICLIWRVSDTLIFYDSVGSFLIELFNSFYSVLDLVIWRELYSSVATFLMTSLQHMGNPRLSHSWYISQLSARYLCWLPVAVYTSDKFGLVIMKGFVAWRPNQFLFYTLQSPHSW